MRPTDALQALSRYAYPVTLVSVASALQAALPVSPTGPVGHVPAKRQAGGTSSIALQGYRGPLRAAMSSLSITVRVAASSGGRAAPKAQGCAATVVLAVTVRYGPHDAWSRDTVVIYDPPPGVHVLTSRAAPTYRVHHHRASVRVPLPRPVHGRTHLTVKLSLRAGPVQVRDRLGRPYRKIGAHVSGRLRIMQGPYTLSSTVLRLLVPIRCTPSQPRVHPRPTATATTTATPIPPATATPLPLPTATPTPAPMQISATIQNHAFSPNPITIAPGSMVTWTNEDDEAHTVMADDGSWGSSTLEQGGTYSHVFTSPGSYTYHCSLHHHMRGTVVVTP